MVRLGLGREGKKVKTLLRHIALHPARRRPLYSLFQPQPVQFQLKSLLLLITNQNGHFG